MLIVEVAGSDTLVSGSWSTTGVTENILSATATLQQVATSRFQYRVHRFPFRIA